MHGQFVWYELQTTDVGGARKFYPRFTGWGTQKFDDDYTMWTIDGVPFAGLFRLAREQGIPPNWMPYVETDDVDATARQATALGGKVLHGPADVPGAGRFAVLQDPQGAVIGIYKSATPATAWDGLPVLGRFSWHELMTTDAVKAAEFYGALFDWEKNGEMDMGGGHMYYMFGKGQRMYGGLFNRTPEMAGMHPFWLCYINVKDVASAVAGATKAGGTVHREPMEIPGGMIAILADPAGAGFAFHQVGVSVPEAPVAERAKAAVGKAATKVATTVNKAVKAVKKTAKKKAKKVARKTAKLMPRLKAKRAAVVRQVKARVKAARAKAKSRVAARPKAKTKAKTKARVATRSKSKSRPGARTAARRKPASRARKTKRARR